jgi:hypothetical protein
VKRSGAAFWALCFLAIASAGYAQTEVRPPPETAATALGTAGTAKREAAPPQEDDRLPVQKLEQWQFFFSPYVWIPGANISTTAFGHTSTVNVPWWDVASQLFSNAMGVMGRFEAWKGRWGFFLDSYFVYLGGNVTDSVGKQVLLGPQAAAAKDLVLSGNLKYITRAGNLDFGPRYLVGTIPLSAAKPLPLLSFELLGGGRYNYLNQYLRLGVSATITGPVVDTTRGQTFAVSATRSYVEPMLGGRLRLWLTPKAVTEFKATFGGFGLVADNNFDSNLELLFGYRVHPNIYAYLGYKARYDQFHTDKISLSVWLHGPVIGAVFAF